MMLIISGHQRSGTTLLRRLCDGHPQMKVANEFGCFADVGLSSRQAWLARLGQWRLVNGRWSFDSRFAGHPRQHWHNLWFTVRFGWRLMRLTRGPLTVKDIGYVLAEQWKETAITGDKLPQYMPLLPRLLTNPSVKALIIYRDCRDVTSSFLEKVRTVWNTRDWADSLNTAEKIAQNWVTQIARMESLADQYGSEQVQIVQYEQLVTQPQIVLAELATWLGINSNEFSMQQIQPNSVGKFRQGLAREELADVWQVAGPTMRRKGYT